MTAPGLPGALPGSPITPITPAAPGEPGFEPRADAPDAPNAPPTPDAGLVNALHAWRSRLGAAGVACREAAFHSADALWVCDFPATLPALHTAWTDLRARLSADNPVVLAKVDGSAGADMLLATSLQLPTGMTGVVGVLLAPPHNERNIQLVLLSLGWLQLALAAASLSHNQRAARLLELMGHVGSQTDARAAAQEWINRTAAWARAEVPALDAGFTLTLFEVRRHQPRWWVAADTAWAETASPAVVDATEAATRAVIECREVQQFPWWAQPLLDDGVPVAVLVARHDAPGGAALPADALVVLRASASLAEPLLRYRREADRALLPHAAHSLRGAWRKLWGPGHLTWKAGGLGAALLLAGLLIWPVPDRVTAHTVIEGSTRQVLTAPFEGFLAQVLVRPGERVSKGQLLARLDDHDLKLEQAKYRSEQSQAGGKLRQAMAERDPPAMALAQAEVLQADAQLALVGAKLARAGLLAPTDGLVVTGDWAQQVGAPVENGKEMFEIASTDAYRVVLHVPDRDIARVRIGQGGELRLTGQPQSGYTFQVSRVTATASVQDGNNGFRVEAAWRGDAPPLSPGLQGVGKIEVGRANLLTVWLRPSLDWLRLKLWSWWW